MKIYAFEHPEAAAELALKIAAADALSTLRMLPAILVLGFLALLVQPAEAAPVDYDSRAHAVATAISAMTGAGQEVVASCRPGGVSTLVFGEARVVLQVVRRGGGWRIVDAPAGVSCPGKEDLGP